MSKSKNLSFNEIINRDQLTLLDFSASWCGPCQAMEPVLKKLSSKHRDDVRILKIDVDRNRALSNKMHIQGVPTFMLFKNGKMLWRKSGMQSGKALEDLIVKYA
ncbi:MAG: thioredoxin family protein [Saprospiraceae bacterium]|nr:thioredoxin family protein [Saprospiraceae bacterium]